MVVANKDMYGLTVTATPDPNRFGVTIVTHGVRRWRCVLMSFVISVMDVVTYPVTAIQT